MKKKIIYIIFSILLIIGSIFILTIIIDTYKYNYDDTAYKYVSGDVIPEGTELNDNIKINKLHKLSESNIINNDFIYKDTIILIDSSPVRRELDTGIMTCWKREKKNLVQIKCSKSIMNKISDTYGINSYEANNTYFKLIYKIK